MVLAARMVGTPGMIFTRRDEKEGKGWGEGDI